jgi:hypothetical protein
MSLVTRDILQLRRESVTLGTAEVKFLSSTIANLVSLALTRLFIAARVEGDTLAQDQSGCVFWILTPSS